MCRGARVALSVCLAAALVVAGCSDDGGNDDDQPTREQGIEVLLQQGYSEAAAECMIDNAKGQDVDVLDVMSRDQVTQREVDVLATVQEFCLKTFPTTPTTAASGSPSDTGAVSVPG